MIQFKPDENSAYAIEKYGKGSVLYYVDGCEEHTRCVIQPKGMNVQIVALGDDTTSPIVIEGLVRSALNYAAVRGAFTAYVSPHILTDSALRVLMNLGFASEKGNLVADIPFVLTGGCHCKKTE